MSEIGKATDLPRHVKAVTTIAKTMAVGFLLQGLASFIGSSTTIITIARTRSTKLMQEPLQRDIQTHESRPALP